MDVTFWRPDVIAELADRLGMEVDDGTDAG